MAGRVCVTVTVRGDLAGGLQIVHQVEIKVTSGFDSWECFYWQHFQVVKNNGDGDDSADDDEVAGMVLNSSEGFIYVYPCVYPCVYMYA